MAGLSFTTSGATPFPSVSGIFSKPAATSPFRGSTPAANALNTAQTTGGMSVYKPPPEPSTPVKKTVVNNTDGSSHVTEYHAPTPQPLASGVVPPKKEETTPTPAPATPTFPGILGSLTDTSTAGSPKAKEYTKQIADYGAGNLDIGKRAADIAAEYGQRIADVGGQGARFQAGQLTTGTSPVAEGNAAVTAQTTAAQQQALAQGEQAALLGTAQELTGQGQAANAANQAAGQEYAGQGLEQTGLTAAGGLAQPTVVGQGQAVFQPGTGEINGGSFDVSTNANNFSKSVLNGSMTYDQAVQALGYSPVGKAALDQAITAAGGNPLQLQATGATTQNVIGTQQETIAGYQSALQQGQNLQAQLTDLISTFGLNPNDINAVNAGLAKIAQNTSSPQYKILQNYVNDIANTYSQILTPPGGSPTDTTRGIATSMLDSTAKGQSLITTMKSLDEAAKAKIAGVSTTGVSAPRSTGTATKTGVVQTSAGAVNTDW